MKKISYIIALAAGIFAAATSCQKEDSVNQNDKQQVQEKGLVFYANLEGSATKTTIGEGYKISWETTDTISINGVMFVPDIDKSNPASATFTKAKNETKDNPTAPYKVYYPASVYDGTIATLPATQIYNAEGNIAGILPMYAESSDMNLNFKNLCGLIKFTLKGTETVQNIILTDASKALSGKFMVSENAAVLDPEAEGGITLDCGAEGVLLNESDGKTFFIAVPAGSYDDLHVEYNTVSSDKRANLKANGTATIERNKVYSFTQTPGFKNVPTITVTDKKDLIVNEDFDVSTMFSSNSDGAFSYSIKGSPSGATLDGTTFNATKTGTYTIVANQAATASYSAGIKEGTICVKATFTITSADVVTSSSYKMYENKKDGRDWLITFGGNTKSVGTNSGNRSKCNLSSYSKYAVSPITSSVVASAFASETKIDNVSKISYTFRGGSSQNSTIVYLLYSSDNTTFSQISLTKGTQGAVISSGTEFEFSKCSGYFAVVFKATNSSGNWRIDDVNLTFTYE